MSIILRTAARNDLRFLGSFLRDLTLILKGLTRSDRWLRLSRLGASMPILSHGLKQTSTCLCGCNTPDLSVLAPVFHFSFSSSVMGASFDSNFGRAPKRAASAKQTIIQCYREKRSLQGKEERLKRKLHMRVQKNRTANMELSKISTPLVLAHKRALGTVSATCYLCLWKSTAKTI